MLQYLFETIPQPLPLKIPMLPIEYAAKEGHLDVVNFKFLHTRMHLSKMPAFYTSPRVFHMYFVVAFARGYMDSIVPYLLDGQMDITVDMAVSLGHLRATQFLLEKDPTCSNLALNKAAQLGAMDILEWIIETKYTRNYHKAYETAAVCGQLKIVQFPQPFVKRSAICCDFFDSVG
ncbi:hypothetical protein Ae201684_017071 [Aphanomyces euteiches]|uniref:Uncharacterized protein n=1 Tax=Aphanomyces euteiches TaxID=100861 RepID=A0A6G0WAJ9_9STRA|nr:hypothetical protein Ae201684_017071 [Aphanomyces euteiches]